MLYGKNEQINMISSITTIECLVKCPKKIFKSNKGNLAQKAESSES